MTLGQKTDPNRQQGIRNAEMHREVEDKRLVDHSVNGQR